MASVFDVAKYILSEIGEMSTWKLQKLCYYPQAWHYTWTEKPLFKEEFQAWVNGPVCPALFYAHKGKYVVNASDISYGNKNNLTDDEKETVDTVLNHYGDWMPVELREQTHAEAPWRIARGNLPDNQKCDEVISLESMGYYYGGL